jgi:hypothetical protein
MKQELNYNLRRMKEEREVTKAHLHALYTIFASSPWKLWKLQDRLA